MVLILSARGSPSRSLSFSDCKWRILHFVIKMTLHGTVDFAEVINIQTCAMWAIKMHLIGRLAAVFAAITVSLTGFPSFYPLVTSQLTEHMWFQIVIKLAVLFKPGTDLPHSMFKCEWLLFCDSVIDDTSNNQLADSIMQWYRLK